jgi:hypothetical protein
MRGSVRSWRGRLGVDRLTYTNSNLIYQLLVCCNRLPMNVTQIKCLLVFGIFAIIGFGPISPGCLIGMYVVVKRPQWFWTLCINLYARPGNFQSSFPINSNKHSRKVRIKYFLCILGLFIIDIAPVPVTPVIAFAIILSRPEWFYTTVENIYTDNKKTLMSGLETHIN